MADALSRNLYLAFGAHDAGSQTSQQIDTAYVAGTSGEAVAIKFIAPVASTTVTAYFYATAITGSPTFRMELRAGSGSDPDRPDVSGAALATSGSDTVPVAGRWSTFALTYTLAAGTVYWVIVYNNHGTPASNHATYSYRGALDYASPTQSSNSTTHLIHGAYTSNGFTTDPTAVAGVCGVIAFSDGTLIGNPYVTTASVHANNANDRGSRFAAPADMIVSGLLLSGVSTSSVNAYAIYPHDSGTALVNRSSSYYDENALFGCRFPPVVLRAGQKYDVVDKFSAAATTGTIYDMGDAAGSGANLPADVLACRPPGVAYVDGATPGSYTALAYQVMAFLILVDAFIDTRMSGGHQA